MTTMTPCRERADWYLDRIDDLLRAVGEATRPAGDEVERCRSMLRELHARFRADQRPLPPGQFPPLAEREYLAAIGEASTAAARVSSTSRPTGRWRDGLIACRAPIQAYVVGLSTPNHQMPPR